jgi:hypothetical protein
MTDNNDLVVVMCPPHSDYPSAPKDQSHSELRDCPKCKNQMWLSEKKKGVLLFSSCIGKEIIFACYHCITKMVTDDPSLFMDSKKVDI